MEYDVPGPVHYAYQYVVHRPWQFVAEEAYIVVPAFFTSIWLWLFAGSGCLLTVARRFDIGFAWFNRHFDIEHKPLQAIGHVSGAIVALVYWGVAVGAWLMKTL